MSNKENKKKRGSTFGDALRTMFLGGRAAKLNSIMEEEQVQSPMRTFMRNFKQKPTAMLGVWLFVVILLVCFIYPIFKPLDLTFQDPSQQNIAPGFSLMSVPDALAKNALQIDGGAYFGAGIDKDGKLYMWGNLTPALKKVPENMGKLVQISCGLDHIVVLNEDNEIFSWGYDRLNVCNVPREVENANIKQIFAGYQHSAAVDDEGKLYTWGNPNVISITQLEVKGNVDKVVLNPNTGVVITLDKKVVCLSLIESELMAVPDAIQGKTVDIAVTDKSGAAVTDDGYVHIWGSSDYGVKDIPEGIQGHVVGISSGRGHFTALLDDGTVKSWGWNFYGQADSPSAENIVSISSDYYQNYAIDANGNVVKWGLSGYLMGSDQYGRDVASRLITGGQVTLTVGAISVIISAVLGILLGGFAGYYGGKVDMFIMRVGEVFNSIPFLPLALVMTAVLGSSVSQYGRMALIMVVLGFLGWPGFARQIRAMILAEREKEFVTAARALGVKEGRIIFRHIMPNVLTIALVNLTLSFALSMLNESSMSYLGFGITEPNVTWGNMLYATNNSTVMQNYWWRWVFPALALSITTIAINMAGDGMRDAIDPKSNDR